MAIYGAASFEIKTPRQFYDVIVVPQYRLFKRSYAKSPNPSAVKSRHAVLSVICTYHFYDWVHCGEQFSVTHFDQHHRGKPVVRDMFELARRITNGSKHFETRHIGSRVEQGFSSGFSSAFAQVAYPALLITKDDGTEVHVGELLKKLIDFWETEKANGSF